MVSARGKNKSDLRISSTKQTNKQTPNQQSKTRKKMTEIVLLIIYKNKEICHCYSYYS